MSYISLVEAKLPPGFRFHPRDEELVCDYLKRKVASTDTLQLMIEVDLNKCEPWDIPGMYIIQFFFLNLRQIMGFESSSSNMKYMHKFYQIKCSIRTNVHEF